MNHRISNLEQAFTPLMQLWLDWNEYNVYHQEDEQLSLVQYIAKKSDTEALEGIFERAYTVFQDESEGS